MYMATLKPALKPTRATRHPTPPTPHHCTPYAIQPHTAPSPTHPLKTPLGNEKNAINQHSSTPIYTQKYYCLCFFVVFNLTTVMGFSSSAGWGAAAAMAYPPQQPPHTHTHTYTPLPQQAP